MVHARVFRSLFLLFCVPLSVAGCGDPSGGEGGASPSVVVRANTPAAGESEKTVRPLGPTFRPPLRDYTVTSRYGQRDGRPHEGIDLAAPVGVEVKTVGGGTKLSSGTEGACGNVVRMAHPVGAHTFESRHCHLSAYAGANGRWYAEGTVIGRVGMTGRTTGPHLHFELRKSGVLQDPAWWIAF